MPFDSPWRVSVVVVVVEELGCDAQLAKSTEQMARKRSEVNFIEC
jgi:hypothetical protein